MTLIVSYNLLPHSLDSLAVYLLKNCGEKRPEMKTEAKKVK